MKVLHVFACAMGVDQVCALQLQYADPHVFANKYAHVPPRVTRTGQVDKPAAHTSPADVHGSTIQINVEYLTKDETVALKVPTEDTIDEVKVKIQKETKIPSDRLKLFLCNAEGTELEGRRTLSYYEVQEGSTLYLGVRSEGHSARRPIDPAFDEVELAELVEPQPVQPCEPHFQQYDAGTVRAWEVLKEEFKAEMGSELSEPRLAVNNNTPSLASLG